MHRMMTTLSCRREVGSRDLRLDNILLDGEGNARLLVKVGMPCSAARANAEGA